jgi:hypothetical protein
VSEKHEPRRPKELFAGDRGAEIEAAFRTAWSRATELDHDVPPPEEWDEVKPDVFLGMCSKCGGSVFLGTSSRSNLIASTTAQGFFSTRCPDPWRSRSRRRGVGKRR